MGGAACVHCGKPLSGRSPGRGLCWAHYRDRSVRARYRRLKPGPNGAGQLAPGEEAAWRATGRPPVADDAPRPGDPPPEDVAAFAAWWAAECERLDALPDLPRVCRLLRCE